MGGGDRAIAQAPRRGAAYSHIPGYTRTQEEEDVLANEVMADGRLSSAYVGAAPLLIAGLNRRVEVLKVLLQAAFGYG